MNNEVIFHKYVLPLIIFWINVANVRQCFRKWEKKDYGDGLILEPLDYRANRVSFVNSSSAEKHQVHHKVIWSGFTAQQKNITLHSNTQTYGTPLTNRSDSQQASSLLSRTEAI